MTQDTVKRITRGAQLSALLISLAFLMSGCIFRVGPNYSRGAVALAPDWREKGDAHVKTDPAEYRNWWTTFQDPVLDGLVDKAYKENLDLRASGVRVLQARALLGIAVGNWYPQQQQAFGSTARKRLSQTSLQALAAPTLNPSQAAFGLLANWEIDFWGKFSRGIESADAFLMASVADYDNSLVSLTADVAGTYITLRTIEKRLSIARENVKVQEQSLKIAQDRFTGGTTTDRDVEQAKAILAGTQADIPSLETQLRQANNLLCVLMGMPPSDLSPTLGSGVTGIPNPPPEVAVGIPADLLRRRPDVRGAELQAAAQCAQIGVATADLLPAFSLNGTFGYEASNVGPFHLSDIWQYRSRTGSMGPSFQWNILNYGQIMNNVRVQDAKFQEAMLVYQNTVLVAQQEVDNALTAFLNAQERAKFLNLSVASAKRSMDLAIIQYQQGITDFTTVLTAEQQLLSQQDSLAVTQGDIALNLVAIYRALGGGWQIREGKDFVPASLQEEMRKRTNWGGLLKPAAYESATGQKPAPALRGPDW